MYNLNVMRVTVILIHCKYDQQIIRRLIINAKNETASKMLHYGIAPFSTLTTSISLQVPGELKRQSAVEQFWYKCGVEGAEGTEDLKEQHAKREAQLLIGKYK